MIPFCSRTLSSFTVFAPIHFAEKAVPVDNIPNPGEMPDLENFDTVVEAMKQYKPPEMSNEEYEQGMVGTL